MLSQTLYKCLHPGIALFSFLSYLNIIWIHLLLHNVPWSHLDSCPPQLAWCGWKYVVVGTYLWINVTGLPSFPLLRLTNRNSGDNMHNKYNQSLWVMLQWIQGSRYLLQIIILSFCLSAQIWDYWWGRSSGFHFWGTFTKVLIMSAPFTSHGIKINFSTSSAMLSVVVFFYKFLNGCEMITYCQHN